jgi:hypothetical protein
MKEKKSESNRNTKSIEYLLTTNDCMSLEVSVDNEKNIQSILNLYILE